MNKSLKIGIIISFVLAGFSVNADEIKSKEMSEVNCEMHNLMGKPEINLEKNEVKKNKDNELSICRIGYFSYFSLITKTPIWVSETLTPEKINSKHVPRSNKFEYDPDVELSSQPLLDDYKYSGFNRGQVATAANMSVKDDSLKHKVMIESFYATNIFPHVGANQNSGIWADIENGVRNLAKNKTLLVVSGPIFNEKENSLKIGKSKIWVPSHIYKVILDKDTGKSIGFIVPNMQIITKKTKKIDIGNKKYEQTYETYNCGSVCNFENFMVSVNDVEKVTSLKFFPKSNTNKANIDKKYWNF